MISRLLLVSAFLISLCVPKLASADEGKSSHNVSLFYGEMSLKDSDHWEPVEKQSTFGVMYDYNPGNWPVNLMAGFSASNKSASRMLYIPNYGTRYATFDGKTAELSVGARKYLMDTGTFRPYLSVGLSSISAEASLTALGVSVSDNSSSIGYFGNGGIMLLMNRFSVGLDLKILTGTSITLYGVPGNADYNRWAVTGGMNF